MPGLYAAYKTYSSGEILTAADLNATDTNHITNQTLEMTDDYSADAAGYHLNTTPSHVTLPTSAAEEIRHLRGGIKGITGGANWDDAPVATLIQLKAGFVTVGTGGEYADINAAVAANKNKIILTSDINTAVQQLWSLNNGVIIGNNYAINGTVAIAGDGILRISGDDNILKDLQIIGTHTSGTTGKGLVITNNKVRNQCYGIKIFQSGAGGTMTYGLDIAGGDYNQIDCIIQAFAGTITSAYSDSGTLNDVRIIDLVS